MSPRSAHRHPGGIPHHRRFRPRRRAAALALAAMGTTAGFAALALTGGAAFGGGGTPAATPSGRVALGSAASGTAAAAASATSTTAALAVPVPTTRLAGADRYATAAAVSAATFPQGAPIAYLATGADYPDALSAAAAAGGRGPVLLGGAGGLPESTILELQRLHPSRVVIVGGTLALPPTVDTAIHVALPGVSVTRVQGPDRYATSALLSGPAFRTNSLVAYVATGAAFPDALTAAAAAAGKGPVVLVPRSGLPAVTAFALGHLQPRQVFVVGGTLAVPMATQQAIAALLPNSTVTRVAGADRWATAAAVSGVAYPNGAAIAYLATGNDFPDALTAAAAAGGRGPVLLMMPDEAPPAILAEVRRLGIARVVLVGGSLAVSDAAAAEVVAVGAPTPTTVVTTTTTVRTTSTTALSVPTTPTTSYAFTATTSTMVGTTPSTLAVPLTPPPPPSPLAAIAVATAEAQLGKPYEWAGAGPASFDCSGLTMFAWAAAGVALPHNAAAQAALLPAVEADPAHLAPGDLIFYDTPIDHVAIYVGSGLMVEAAHSGVPVRLVPMRTGQLIGAGRP